MRWTGAGSVAERVIVAKALNLQIVAEGIETPEQLHDSCNSRLIMLKDITSPGR